MTDSQTELDRAERRGALRFARGPTRSRRVARAACLAAALAALAVAPRPARAQSQEGGSAAPGHVVRAPGGDLALSGSLYLFEYRPAMKDVPSRLEVYAFLLDLDGITRDRNAGVHAELRVRDTKLRSFFLSNVWFQEVYGYLTTAAGDLRAGKVFRKVGLLWDDSFFGNVPYFNGLKLNPGYGVELAGSRGRGSRITVAYSGQLIANNDHVDGALPGRDVESDSLARMSDEWNARIVPTIALSPGASLAIGLSGSTAGIRRASLAGKDFRVTQAAVDATLSAGPSVSYAELLSQVGERDDAAHPLSRPGYDTASYFLAGSRWQVHPRLNLRLNVSQALYRGGDAREFETVPGLVYRVREGVSVIAEFDYWELRPRRAPRAILDRSGDFVLNVTF
ncbi:MAG TPA: hypothetical protein VF363_10995 [Candidatus Eisenbacteria bacterium]